MNPTLTHALTARVVEWAADHDDRHAWILPASSVTIGGTEVTSTAPTGPPTTEPSPLHRPI